ncbi:MAG: peptide-methionine (S)-S-oxide reductase MsrA [Hyphomicrobiales bacterium]|nr:peptide-methionine (S)-S-oxide reductase MsrA [Hyphomicrobiales bacterium]
MQAMFGAGCFWGIEDSFRKLDMTDVAVGYSGDHKAEPTYEQVCQGNTDHFEVVLIDYDENIISFEQLLTNLFECHNPTPINRRGPDVGSQYKQKLDASGQFKQPLPPSSPPPQPFVAPRNITNNILRKTTFNIARHKLTISPQIS